MFKTIKIKSVLDDSLVKDIPNIEVFVGSVTDPKNLSKVVLELNSRCPLPGLNHLKRVKAKQTLLFPCGSIDEKEVHKVLEKKGFPVNLLRPEVERIKVAESPPLVRQQYLNCNANWPCNFHPNKYLEKVFTNTLFEEKDLEKISIFMDMAKEISRFHCDVPAVVVIDPKLNSVVAVGYSEGSMRHSVMVAIDNVAKSQNGGAWKKSDELCDQTENNYCLNGIPQSILVQLKQKYIDVSFGASVFSPKNGDPQGPYLCTGYDVYTVKEPCVMCAMALIHSRARRVFYRDPTGNGALGSLCKIHTVKGLNHHYEVFIVERNIK